MSERTYKVELMGKTEPTYILESDMIKLVREMDGGARMVLVGRSFINPASVARISRSYNVDANDGVVEQPAPEMKELLMGKEIRKLK